MTTLDQYAHCSKLRGVSPAAKASFALGGLVVCVSASGNALSLALFCVMAFACVVKSGVGVRAFFRLCAIPFWFVLIGALTVAVRFTGAAGGLFALPLFGHFLVLTTESAARAISLFLKSMASVSCLYFLCVSTTMNELLGLLDRLRCPKLFTELMMLIYRFIFVLLEIAEQLSIAQKSRLGDLGYKNRMRSVAILGGGIFIKAFKRSGDILNAMESRGYNGDVAFTTVLVRMSRAERLLLAGWLLLLLCAALGLHLAGL